MKSATAQKLSILVILSILLGIYIPFFFVFVNAEFLRLIDPEYLPFAFIIGGVGGLSFAKLFEFIEKNLPTKSSLILFSTLISLVLTIIWGLYNFTDVRKDVLVFLLYSWFWISSSIVIMIFWKIPTLIFDLSENKKYNSFISIGEVFSAILVYIIVIPLIENFNLFGRENFLLISFLSLFIFSSIISGLNFESQTTVVKPKKEVKNSSVSIKSLFNINLFKYLFISVVIVTFVQLIVDFSLMNIVNAKKGYLNFSIASFFSFVYGSMRILELIFKVFVAKKIMNQYGVLGGFYSMIFVIGLIYCIGLLIHNAGDSNTIVIIILAVAAMGKVMERSINRAVYLPSQNVLFQAFDKENKSIIQSYISGLGVPIGLISSGLLMLVLFLFESYYYKILFLFGCIILSNYVWFVVSKKLKDSYYKQLEIICSNMKSFEIESAVEEPSPIDEPIHSDGIIKSFLSKVPDLKNYNKDELINELILFNSQLSSNNSFIFQVSPQEKNELQEWVKILVHEKIDITLYESLTLLVILNFNIEEVSTVLENSNTSSIREFIDGVEAVYDKDERNINLLREKILLFKTIFYSRVYERNSKGFFESIKYGNSNDQYKILQYLIINHDISLKESVLYQNLLRGAIEKYCIVINLISTLQADSSLSLVARSLNEERLIKMKVIFSILALKYDGKLIFNIEKMIMEGNKESSTLATEMLELNLDEHDFELLSPILKYQSADKILKTLDAEFPQPVYTIDDALKSIILFYKNILSNLTQNLALYYLINHSETLRQDEYFTRFLFGDIILMEQFNLNQPKFHKESKPFELKANQKESLRELIPAITQIASDFLDQKLPLIEFKSFFLNYDHLRFQKS
ncbi:MAG: hypothetical protein ACPGC6_04975 [Flavobacteriaceae bacterium]